jgi:hypothetical protein
MFSIGRCMLLWLCCCVGLSAQAQTAREEGDLRAGQQAAACLFMWTAAPMFSAAAYLPTFMLERALFRRERSDGIYNIFTYYAAKWVEEVIIAVPCSLVFCGIVYAAVGFSGNFGFFWITWLITLLTCTPPFSPPPSTLLLWFHSARPTLQPSHPSYSSVLDLPNQFPHFLFIAFSYMFFP